MKKVFNLNQEESSDYKYFIKQLGKETHWEHKLFLYQQLGELIYKLSQKEGDI